MTREIKIEYILFWVLIALLIFFLLWRAFGASPTVEAIGLILTGMGAILGWYSIKGSDRVFSKLEKLDGMEQEEKKQTQILLNIENILRKKQD